MTLGELLFKLLPFTSIDDGTVKFLGWGLLSDSDKIITSIEMFLFFIFIYTTTKLIKSWISDKKQINILLSILTKYKDKDIGLEYNNLVAEIEKSDKNLKHIWNEFNESFT